MRERARPRELHVLTFSTPETCELLHCWFSWTAAMTRRDTRTRYHLHVEAPGEIASGRHVVRGHRPVWFEALRMRLRFVVRFMNSSAVDEGDLVIFHRYGVPAKKTRQVALGEEPRNPGGGR